MAIDATKFNINPFSSPLVGAQITPPSAKPTSFLQSAGIFGTTNPFNKTAFTGLREGTQNGLSLLRTEPGEMKLANPIQTADGDKRGGKLFITV